ncbi:MAG TPA: carboxypeptidase regulatory-like domain-containing protein, partial [Cryomorphaceae bacterium]|nr:carboxypeptidase regulatory-like domain-containing protein [Cryomorphaceae bacterium]
MVRNLYLLGFVFLVFSTSLFAQVGAGTLKGTLVDSETGEPLPFVNIVLQKGDRQVTGSATDFDGKYTIKPIPPGVYDVLVSYVGYNAKKIEGVQINNDKITFVDIELDAGVRLKEFEVVEYNVPLIDKDGGSSGGTVSREDIARMPGRNANAIAATVGGVQQNNDGTSIRGAREENTFYYIDGIKIRGNTNLPKAAIEEVQVMTGGIPASYGDATGGIIAITTRGASSQWFGGIDVLTSGFANQDGDGIGLDRYSQTQIE